MGEMLQYGGTVLETFTYKSASIPTMTAITKATEATSRNAGLYQPKKGGNTN
jgi:hypothetical protein